MLAPRVLERLPALESLEHSVHSDAAPTRSQAEVLAVAREPQLLAQFWVPEVLVVQLLSVPRPSLDLHRR